MCSSPTGIWILDALPTPTLEYPAITFWGSKFRLLKSQYKLIPNNAVHIVSICLCLSLGTILFFCLFGFFRLFIGYSLPLFFIGILLLYNVVLVFAVQHGSAICIHLSPHTWASIPPFSQSMGWAPCAIQQLPTIYFTLSSIYMSILLSQFVPHSPPPLYSNVHSLHPCLYSCSANRFLCTIFLDSIYVH